MDILTYFLLMLKIIISTFVFRYQRTTLSISRAILGVGDKNLQIILTPNWIGALGWLDTILSVVIITCLFVYFWWVWVLLFIAYVIFIAAFIDVVSPFPSYRLCFKLIKMHLNKELLYETGVDKNSLNNILKQVISIEKQYLGDKNINGT